MRTQIGIGAPALNRLIGLGGRMPTLSSVVAVPARCRSTAVCHGDRFGQPCEPEKLEDLGALGPGEQRDVVEDRGEAAELRSRRRRGADAALTRASSAAASAISTAAGILAATPPRVSGVTPGACEAEVIAVRSATRDRSAAAVEGDHHRLAAGLGDREGEVGGGGRQRRSAERRLLRDRRVVQLARTHRRRRREGRRRRRRRVRGRSTRRPRRASTSTARGSASHDRRPRTSPRAATTSGVAVPVPGQNTPARAPPMSVSCDSVG